MVVEEYVIGFVGVFVCVDDCLVFCCCCGYWFFGDCVVVEFYCLNEVFVVCFVYGSDDDKFRFCFGD